MRTTTIAALALGLLIAIAPAALAFQPVRWQPPWGHAKKLGTVSDTKAVQYKYMNDDYQILDTKYGTRFGGDSLRRRIQFSARYPGSFQGALQRRLAKQQGPAIFQSVDLIEGQPGKTEVVMSGEEGLPATDTTESSTE